MTHARRVLAEWHWAHLILVDIFDEALAKVALGVPEAAGEHDVNGQHTSRPDS